MTTDYIEQNGSLYRIQHDGSRAGKPTIEVIENPNAHFRRIDPDSEKKAYADALVAIINGAIERMAHHKKLEAENRTDHYTGGSDAAA